MANHDPKEVAFHMVNVRGKASAIYNCDKYITQKREPPMGREFWKAVKEEIQKY